MDFEMSTVYYATMIVFGFAGFVKTVLDIFEKLHRHSENCEK